MPLDIRCDNFLTGNHHVYAIKASRKKIAILRIQAANGDSSSVRLLLGGSRLTAEGKTYNVEDPVRTIRRFSEFTWDFLLYSIIDFHPVLALIDASLFLTGPVYNRRLKRQLALLSNSEMCLAPGESKTALLAFRGVRPNTEHLLVPAAAADGSVKHYELRIHDS
jgi:hypothetical protein